MAISVHVIDLAFTMAISLHVIDRARKLPAKLTLLAVTIGVGFFVLSARGFSNQRVIIRYLDY